jgi:hypothetical protein
MTIGEIVLRRKLPLVQEALLNGAKAITQTIAFRQVAIHTITPATSPTTVSTITPMMLKTELILLMPIQVRHTHIYMTARATGSQCWRMDPHKLVFYTISRAVS